VALRFVNWRERKTSKNKTQMDRTLGFGPAKLIPLHPLKFDTRSLLSDWKAELCIKQQLFNFLKKKHPPTHTGNTSDERL
jgi:hypothetical protein